MRMLVLAQCHVPMVLQLMNKMVCLMVASVQLGVISQDNLSDEASGLQVVNEELPGFDDTSVREIGATR